MNSEETAMSKADELFREAFSVPRDRRSEEYKAGVLDMLRFRLGEASTVAGSYRYELGTAQADAYFSGCDEGHRRAREYLTNSGARDQGKPQ
jgi:hypothetical protein